MGASAYLPGNSAAGAGVIHGPEWPKHEVDEELRTLLAETTAWLPAIRGAVEAAVDENHSPNRDHSFLAIQVAIDNFNKALEQLVAAVKTRSIVT